MSAFSSSGASARASRAARGGAVPVGGRRTRSRARARTRSGTATRARQTAANAGRAAIGDAPLRRGNTTAMKTYQNAYQKLYAPDYYLKVTKPKREAARKRKKAEAEAAAAAAAAAGSARGAKKPRRSTRDRRPRPR